jgi:serine phosphatase RsbU (regulator of sigma subunit)
MRKNILLTLLIFLSIHGLAYSQIAIDLEKPMEIVSVGTSVFFLEDTSSLLNIEEILNPNYQQKFKLSDKEIPNFANTTSAIWGKFTVENKQTAKWLLEIGNPLLDSIFFYSPQPDGSYAVQQTGAMFAHDTRSYRTNLFLFKLTEAQDSTKLQTFYFRIKSNFPLQIPLKISTLQPFFEDNHRTDTYIGIYLGFMLVMACYNLFVFFSVRDKIYLYYVGYVIFLSVLYANFKGYAFELLWTNKPIVNFFIPVNANIATTFMLLFAANFLHIKEHLPRVYKFIYVIFFALGVSTILNIAGNYIISSNISQPFTLITALYLLVVSVILLFKGVKIARFYFIAWVVYLVGLIVYILNLNSAVPSNAFTNNSILFGSALEVVLLSFALADKINVLKREKETAQVKLLESLQANEALILGQNKVLEERVAQRTHELQETNEELNQVVEELNATNETLSRFNLQLGEQQKEIAAKNNELSETIQELNATNEELASTNEALGMANEEVESQREAVTKAYDSIKILTIIGQQITQTLDLKAVIRMVYENVNQLMDADGFGLGVYNARTKEIVFDGFMEKGKELPFHFHKTEEENYLAVWCFRRQKNIIINDVESEMSNYIDKDVDKMKISAGEVPQSLLYIPLVLEGNTLGVITVQSFSKNAYTEAHFGLLQNLAAYCSIAVANANAYQEIDSKNANITKSIEYAQTIQQAVLPKPAEIRQTFSDKFIIYKPKDIVSGDFYWYNKSDKFSFFAVSDCTGHGVPGGFMSMIGNAILQDAIDKQHLRSPAAVLEFIHLSIRKALRKAENHTSDGMDIALCMFEDLGNGNWNMTFSAAKRPLYIFLKENGEFLELKGDKGMIGAAETMEKKPFTDKVMSLKKGDKLYMFSDGFTDQPDDDRNRFGIVKFKEMLIANHTLPMAEQKVIYEKELKDFQGLQAQRDDITVAGLEM